MTRRTPLFSLALAAAALTAAAANRPAAAATQVLRFGLASDTNTSSTAARDKFAGLLSDAHANGLQFMTIAGDLVNDAAVASQWNLFSGVYNARPLPVYTAIGNHDTHETTPPGTATKDRVFSSATYTQRTGYEANYAFQAGPARFVSITSSGRFAGDLAWEPFLRQQLTIANNDPATKFVFVIDHFDPQHQIPPHASPTLFGGTPNPHGFDRAGKIDRILDDFDPVVWLSGDNSDNWRYFPRTASQRHDVFTPRNNGTDGGPHYWDVQLFDDGSLTARRWVGSTDTYTGATVTLQTQWTPVPEPGAAAVLSLLGAALLAARPGRKDGRP